jgi:hypothetical protein
MAASVTLVKRFQYRGVNEDFSNTYHLDGTPADAAAWKTLADTIWTAEKAHISTNVALVHGYGHTSDTTPAIWSYDYSLDPAGPFAGTFPETGCAPAPGDAAYWVRWDTGRYTSKGKKIYLRKYFHRVMLNTTGGDSIKTGQVTAAQTFGTNMLTMSSGGVHMAGPDGTRPPGPAAASIYATTRTLKRRGKRPGP